MTDPPKRDDMIVHSRRPYNAEPPRSALAGSFRTPLEAFYCRNHGDVPRPNVSTWRLTVDGQVREPFELSLGRLRSEFDHHTLTATLQCAGNRRTGLAEVRDIPGESRWGPGATGTAEWTGARLRDVLIAAGVQPEAAHVAFGAPDVSDIADPPQSFGASVGIDKAMSGEVLLAWEMNGRPLPAAHGAPVRVLVPGYIGARSVKWVDRITARKTPSQNYFQAISYRLLPPDGDPSTPGPESAMPLGPVALNADILDPDDGQFVAAGLTEVTGYAFAGGGRRVVRVDVSADGGRSWRQAELFRDWGRQDERDQDQRGQTGEWAWSQWRAILDLAPGSTEIVARAWDSAGAAQPEHPGPLWNPKGYVNNSWARVRVHAAQGKREPRSHR